jgi:hypothetical protein
MFEDLISIVLQDQNARYIRRNPPFYLSFGDACHFFYQK